MNNTRKWVKPAFNSVEENYMEVIEYIRTSFQHRSMETGPCPLPVWRNIIREQIKHARMLRAQCDPIFLMQFRQAIRG